MAHSDQKPNPNPNQGAMKIYLITRDEINLNYTFFSNQDQKIRHMKISEPSKIPNFRPNEW